MRINFVRIPGSVLLLLLTEFVSMRSKDAVLSLSHFFTSSLLKATSNILRIG